MPRVFDLIRELAEYERLSHALTGSAETLAQELGRGFQCRVLESEGEVVAYALYFFNYSTFLTRRGLYLEDIYVQPTHRGRGFGKALLLDLRDRAQELGCGRMEWSVLDWNQPAIDFYKSLGAQVMPDWRICRIEL